MCELSTLCLVDLVTTRAELEKRDIQYTTIKQFCLLIIFVTKL